MDLTTHISPLNVGNSSGTLSKQNALQSYFSAFPFPLQVVLDIGKFSLFRRELSKFHHVPTWSKGRREALRSPLPSVGGCGLPGGCGGPHCKRGCCGFLVAPGWPRGGALAARASGASGMVVPWVFGGSMVTVSKALQSGQCGVSPELSTLTVTSSPLFHL